PLNRTLSLSCSPTTPSPSRTHISTPFSSQAHCSLCNYSQSKEEVSRAIQVDTLYESYECSHRINRPGTEKLETQK
ncbi:13185_t:CDS:2, partial [Acaulospora colombiana]